MSNIDILKHLQFEKDKTFSRVRNCKVSVFNKKITNFNTNVKIPFLLLNKTKKNAVRETTDWPYVVLVLLRNRNCIKLHMYSRSEKSLNIIRYISSFIVKHYIAASGTIFQLMIYFQRSQSQIRI